MFSVLSAVHLACLLFAAAVFVAAAVNDARFYRIPNRYCLALLAAYPVYVVTAPLPVDWLRGLAVFAAVGAGGYILYLTRLIGAGDIKLMTVAALWAGTHYITVFLGLMAVAGGVLASVIALRLFIARRRGKELTLIFAKPIPYGIAIAAGGLTVLGLIVQPILLPL